MKKTLLALAIFLLARSLARAGDAELYVIEATIPPTPSVTPSSTPSPTPVPHLVKPSAKNLTKMKEWFNFQRGLSLVPNDEGRLYILRDPDASHQFWFFPEGSHLIIRSAKDEELSDCDQELKAELKAEEEPESSTADKALSKLEMQLGFGSSIPESGSQLLKKYGTGSAFSLGFGVKLTNSFAVLWVLDAGEFDGNNDPVNTSSQFFIGDTALLGKLRFATGDFRPYVYAGPGFEFNSYNFNFTYNGLSATASLSETDFMAEGGVRLEVQVVPSLFLFIQGGVDYDLTSQGFAGIVSTDNPSVYFPVLGGIVWGR